MKGKNILVLAVAIFASTAVEAKLPRNSYIMKPAYTKDSFIAHVKSNPTVMDRYMRHFAMNRQEVLDYFSTIRKGTLQTGGLYTVYNVPSSTGVLRSRLLKMKKGEPMWLDQYGTPVMVVVCGNPVTRGPRNPIVYNEALPKLETEVLNESYVRPDSNVAYVSTPMEPGNMTTAMEPAMPQNSEVVGESANTYIPGGPVLQGIAGTNNLLPLVLSAVPLVAIPNLHKKTNPPPVPEPTTLFVLGSAAAVALRKRSR